MHEAGRVPALQVAGLHVFYGSSHALQGVDLLLPSGVLAVVGRNGMGKTTLCKAIMGLVPARSGSIRFAGQELAGRSPAEIARLGIGYVPQGRRLWRSLTVDEHLRLVSRGERGAWTRQRIYDIFPRLAERRGNGGGQLSGGEQQMLAISRALLLNPRLLVMDEPTEGLAPVIVAQVEAMLHTLAEAGDMAVLVIEQNIGVATAVSEHVAIMVNGRVNRVVEAATLAHDRELQQRLLGVGRHGATASAEHSTAVAASPLPPQPPLQPTAGPVRIYLSNPVPPTRWSQPVPGARIEAAARTTTPPPLRSVDGGARAEGAARGREPYVIVAGTFDTKGTELRYIRDLLQAAGLRTRTVDVSTSGRVSGAEVPPLEVALQHPRGGAGVFAGDRGEAITAMAAAFRTWIARQSNVVGIISAAGSGGTALVTPGMRALPIGTPKLMISTVASGDIRAYIGASDILMLPAITDVQGLNRLSREILGNGAQALAGMVRARLEAPRPRRAAAGEPPVVGMTMFGVTTPCVQQTTALLDADYECLVFHATGIGGQTMESLVESGMIGAVLDLTTTELCDLLLGGVLPAHEDRLGAVIRTRIPYVGSVGALDMVNFGAPATIPERYRERLLHVHNPHVTLMRTTPDENARMGVWLGERLNRMTGPVRFLLPEGGVSALDAPGQAFHDPTATAALFAALEATVRPAPARQLIRLPHHINDPAFAAAAAQALRQVYGIRKRARAG